MVRLIYFVYGFGWGIAAMSFAEWLDRNGW